MLYEYAVEPASLSRFNAIWQALEQFGVPSGRMIVAFPKKWLREVYNATSDCPDVERKALEERLARLKKKLMASARGYDRSRTWRENAQQQQEVKPFRAIVQCDNEEGCQWVLTQFDFHDGNELWKVRAQDKVDRTAEALAACVVPLGMISREVKFIDTYSSTDPKWVSVLVEFLESCLRVGAKFRRIEIHTGDKTPLDFLEQTARERIVNRLPPGVDVHFLAWRRFEDGERLHARYVLTDRGGIGFDVGLDEGKPGETTDVRLLSQELYEMRWREFQPNSHTFELVGQFTLVAAEKCHGR